MNPKRAFAASLILALAIAALVGSRWDSLVSSNAPGVQADTTPIVATAEPTNVDAVTRAGRQAGDAGASTGLTGVEEPTSEDNVERSGDDHEDDDDDYDDDDHGYDDDDDHDDDDEDHDDDDDDDDDDD